MSVKKLIVAIALLCVTFVIPKTAQAVVIYGPDGFGSLAGWNTSGVVYSGTFGSISSPASNPYAILTAGDIFYILPYNSSMRKNNISTAGYQDITLSYYRRLRQTDADDALIAQWKPHADSTWLTLESVSSADWVLANWSLPSSANDSSVDIRFRMTSNERAFLDLDFGFVDGVQLTGNLIPEPATLSLLGLGLLGLLRFRKKKV